MSRTPAFARVLPNLLTRYRPTKPVAPKTVTFKPETEDLPPTICGCEAPKHSQSLKLEAEQPRNFSIK